MPLAERTENVGMAETGFSEIEAASETAATGGYFEALPAKACAIRDRLAASELKPAP